MFAKVEVFFCFFVLMILAHKINGKNDSSSANKMLVNQILIFIKKLHMLAQKRSISNYSCATCENTFSLGTVRLQKTAIVN